MGTYWFCKAKEALGLSSHHVGWTWKWKIPRIKWLLMKITIPCYAWKNGSCSAQNCQELESAWGNGANGGGGRWQGALIWTKLHWIKEEVASLKATMSLLWKVGHVISANILTKWWVAEMSGWFPFFETEKWTPLWLEVGSSASEGLGALPWAGHTGVERDWLS